MKHHQTLLALSAVLSTMMALDAVGATVVKPTAVTVTGAATLFPVDNIINGSGLSAPLNTGDELAPGVTHNWGLAVNTDSWVSTDPGGFPADWFAASGTTPVLVFDLGVDRQIDTAHFWNYGGSSGVAGTAQGNAAKTVEIRYNTAAQGNVAFAGNAVTGTLAHAPLFGEPTGSVLPQLNVPLGGIVTARYVQVRITDNWYVPPGDGTGTDEHGHPMRGGDRVGLGEVRFSLSPPEVSAYAQAVLGQNPIAYWRFNDGLTTPAVDTAANLGSGGAALNGIYAGATHPVPGALVGSPNTAARMAGGTSVSIPYRAALNPGGAFAVEAWLRPAAANPAGTLTCAISSVQVNSPRSGWLIYQSDTGWNFRTYNQNGTATAVSITGGSAPVVGNWYHVVAVWDGAVGTLYVNGVLAATSPATTYVPSPDTAFTIGMRSDAAFVWAGDADEVALYSSALSGTRIATHYANGTGAAPSPSYDQVVLADAPTAYWRLDEAAFAAPVAANSGSLGTTANGSYFGGAIDGAEAPRPPQFPGFESGNTAVQLDGLNDYVGSISGLMNSRPSFTLSGWIRRDGDQAARTGLWGQNDLVEFGYINNDTLEVWTDNGLDISPNSIPNGQWAHLAIVQDGSPGTMTMYTNGVPAGSRQSVLPANNNFAFNIGGGGVFDGAANFFKGQIDEVAVFAKALPAEEISAQYFSTIPNVAPFITRQPVATNLLEGDTIALSVAAAGSGPLQYQWTFDFTPIPGANRSSLVIPDASVDNGGEYWVDVINSVGTVMSVVIRVDVAPAIAPIINTQPQSATRYAGAAAVFRVDASGGSRLRYQWQRNGADLPNATNSTYAINNVQAADIGAYRVVLVNSGGTTTSDVASLTLLTPAPGFETEVVNGRPLAYWRLGEASGPTAHDYWGGFDGTYTDVRLGVPGALTDDSNTAGDFNGTSSYVGTPLSLNGVSAFTIVGWMRRNADQADRTGLWGQNDLVEFGYINNNTLEVWTDNGLDITPNSIPNGEWAQVALVNEGSPGTITMYTNAESAGSRLSTLPAANGFKFNIGGGGVFDAAGNFFNGSIDDLAVFDRALSQAEICKLFTLGSGRYARPCCNDKPTFAVAADSTASDEDAAPVSVAGWVTDISPGPADESSQTITIHVSNNNPGLFSAQPAIDPAGTLTYATPLNANGSAVVSVYLTDSGPAGGCDNNTSLTKTFTIVVRPANDCPVASPQSARVDQDSQVNVPLSGSDLDGDALTYEITSAPAHGQASILPGSAAATYVPNPGYCGTDSFKFRAFDGTCRSEDATVTITVRCVTECPIAVAKVANECRLSPNSPTVLVLSANSSNAPVVLDASLSSAADGGALTYIWLTDLGGGGPQPFATGVRTTNTFELGTHVIVLAVDDGHCLTTTSITVEVITVCEALDQVVEKVNQLSTARPTKRPLIASLKAACASFDRGNCQSGSNQLNAFINKIRAQVSRTNPIEAIELIRLTQKILDCVDCSEPSAN